MSDTLIQYKHRYISPKDGKFHHKDAAIEMAPFILHADIARKLIGVGCVFEVEVEPNGRVKVSVYHKSTTITDVTDLQKRMQDSFRQVTKVAAMRLGIEPITKGETDG